jgi:hypothetical protein
MREGAVIFQGAIGDVIGAARGKVWNVTTAGAKPEGDYTVISTMRHAASAQYRVVGEGTPPGDAQPVEPGLEDAYVWLMRDTRDSHAALPR